VPKTKEVAMAEFKVLSKEAIARRAYEFYVECGGEPGKDVQDWIRAEKELNGELNVGSAKTKTAQAGGDQQN
jgi:hypothetical protein